MNNYEYMKNINIEQLSHFLCESMDYLEVGYKSSCDICPVNAKCKEGLNGWLEWLKGEHK